MLDPVIIGDCKLYLGDSREVLPPLPMHDLLLTDPPFGISYAAQPTKYQRAGGRVAENWDDVAPHELVDLAIRKASDTIVWGGNYFALPPSRGWLLWFKKVGYAQSFADFELAWTSIDMNSKCYEMSSKAASLERGIASEAHPNQKPLGLMAWCLSFAPKAKTIFDPFMGSGTTGVACVSLGKSFTGIERERKYFDIACERIERAYSQPRLFDEKVSHDGTPAQEPLL